MGKRNHVTKRPGRSTAKGERVREPRTVRRPQSGVAIDTLDTDQAAEPGAPQYAPPASPRDPTHSLAPLEGLEGSLADERPSDSTASPAPHAPSPPMVGIGASAGGLDAFLRLLRHMPADTGLALVLVQHLDPAHESLLPELLGRDATIPVVQAQDGMLIEADHAYVIPPNTTMTVTEGHLRVVARKSGRGVHLPIDALLCSLAEVHGTAVVGVILSGAGSDGTRGIEAIKEAGGITIAQDLATASYPSMPQSAVVTGYVDFVLSPEEIADQLVRLGRHLGEPPRRRPRRRRPFDGRG